MVFPAPVRRMSGAPKGWLGLVVRRVECVRGQWATLVGARRLGELRLQAQTSRCQMLTQVGNRDEDPNSTATARPPMEGGQPSAFVCASMLAVMSLRVFVVHVRIELQTHIWRRRRCFKDCGYPHVCLMLFMFVVFIFPGSPPRGLTLREALFFFCFVGQ